VEPLLLDTTGRDDLALVHLLQLGPDPTQLVETVDSVDPRFPRREKTVIILSTQFGCAVGCPICDAGGGFAGNLSAEQMLAQVRFVLRRRPEILDSKKLKVHFARMGEPAHNATAVLQALEQLPGLLPAPGLMPCVATVAPRGSQDFLKRLGRLKDRLYGGGRFQLQVSVNSTDPGVRRRLIPTPHLDLRQVAAACAGFHRPGQRKVALNFALAREVPVDVALLSGTFNPGQYMVKLTPVNPTRRAREHGLETVLSAGQPRATEALVERLRAAGFDVVVSIGEPDEIAIGSNCGQLVRAHLAGARPAATDPRQVRDSAGTPRRAP
jgi:23S rRNA (adenine2503-C2)-methyltransferase